MVASWSHFPRWDSKVPLAEGPVSGDPLPWNWAECSQFLSFLARYPRIPQEDRMDESQSEVSPMLASIHNSVTSLLADSLVFICIKMPQIDDS